MKRCIRLLPALLILASQACAPRPAGQPRWVSEPHRDHPSDRYLVGAATGANRNEAVDLAIARLSQQVEVRVNATEQRRTLSSMIAAVSADDSTTFASEVRLTTNATLLGVEIAGASRLHNGAYAALATLDIDRSIGLYDDAIRRLEALRNADIDRAESADSTWAELVAVSDAMTRAVERDILVVTRSVIAARGSRHRLPVVLSAPPLITRFESLRDRISLSVVPIGACPPGFVLAAEAALSHRGLPVQRDHPGSIQLRIGWHAVTAQTYDPRWWACRWRLRVTLYDADRGVTIAGHPSPGDTVYALGEEAALAQSQEDARATLVESIGVVLGRPGASTDRGSGDTISNTQHKEPPR
jgi:hypothetical protein